jgi:anti-sigma-K factor RskA
MDYTLKTRKRGKDKETERRIRNGGYSSRHVRQSQKNKTKNQTSQEPKITKPSYKTKIEKYNKSHGKKNKTNNKKENNLKTE